MKNEQITIEVGIKTMIVTDGKVDGAKKWYQAPGLEIYVSGRVCKCREHTVHYLAVDAAVSRHIPAISLYSTREPRKPKTQPKNLRQRSMF